MRGKRKLRRVSLTAAHRLVRPLRLRRLERVPHPQARLLATAILSAARGSTTPEEREWIDRIEAIRIKLARSEEPIRSSLAEWTGADDHQAYVVVNSVAEICQKSRPRLWAQFLFRLIRESRPQVCLELGTGAGISAAYQAAALELNGRGSLFTVEAASSRAELACEVLRELRLETRAHVITGRFADVLPGVLHANRLIDFVYVDGDHSGEATVRYFEVVAPSLARSAIVVFDDIAYSDDMAAAWERIRRDQRVGLSVDLGPVGVCFVAPGAGIQTMSVPVDVKPATADRTWLASRPRIERVDAEDSPENTAEASVQKLPVG